MAYTTEAKIRKEAGFQNNDVITPTTITEYQTRAFNIVKGYVSSRYTVSNLSGALFTGSQAQSILEQAELLMAAGLLMKAEFQGQIMGESGGQQKIDQAQKILDDIASGKLTLVDVNGDEFTADVPSSNSLQITFTAPPRLNADPSSSERNFSVDQEF